MSHKESMETLGEPLHIDHMAPQVKGGMLSIENSSLLCKTCNLKKGSKTLREFLRYMHIDETTAKREMERLEEMTSLASSELKRLVMYYIHKGKGAVETEEKLNNSSSERLLV